MKIPITNGKILSEPRIILSNQTLATLRRIHHIVAEAYGLKPEALVMKDGRRRPEYLVWPRQVAMFLQMEMTMCCRTILGEYWHRERQTVQNSVKTVNDRIETDPKVAARVAQLRKQVEAR